MNHIMIDCYKANEIRLNDLMGINSLIDEIVASLNLPAVMPPFLLPYYYAKDSADDGISAFVILEGGHITFHTFPHRECVFIDLMCDGYFDANRLDELLKRYFLYGKQKTVRTERRYLDTSIDDDRVFRPHNAPAARDFGPHIIARADNIEGITLERLYNILDDMPQHINMCPICRPYVLKSSVKDPRYISGMVLIAQSHIAFHYEIAAKTLYCDMFSCSFYKSEQFLDYLADELGTFEHMTVIRGSKHEEQVRNEDARKLRMSRWLKNAGRQR